MPMESVLSALGVVYGRVKAKQGDAEEVRKGWEEGITVKGGR